MSDELTDDSVPAVAKPFRLQWEEAQDAYVLLFPEGMVKLNPSAGEILSHCDGARRVADVIRDLESKFPGADLAKDVRTFLELARGKGWIRTK